MFISSLAWSDRNAIGAQLSEFAVAFEQPIAHCYWDTSTGLSTKGHSHCLEPTLAARWPFRTGRGFLQRLELATVADGWERDRLRPERRRRLRRGLGHVRFALVAPLSCRDARRSLDILDALKIPYVVQLWDALDIDGLHLPATDYAPLLNGARHVFCLSSNLLRDVQAITATPASILSFARPDTTRRARPPSGKYLRLAILGHLHPYRDGIALLSDAIFASNVWKHSLSVSYIGPEDQVDQLPASIRALTTVHGFVNAEKRDRLLADCHVAYCPGPLRGPSDPRSRYSIPSRMADYFAVGIPVIAAIHPQSAIHVHYSADSAALLQACTTPTEISRALSRLSDAGYWHAAARATRSYFEQHMSRFMVLRSFHAALAQIHLQ